jgi:hypothetical protein
MTSERFYTLPQFLKALVKLEVKNSAEYNFKKILDPKLPARPHRHYPEWSGWKTHSLSSIKIYSYLQAKYAVKKLQIKTSSEYRHIRLLDEKLPSDPKHFYAKEWEGWHVFCVNKKSKRSRENVFYTDIQKAMSAVKKLGITNTNQYRIEYKKDPMLPSTPRLQYAKDWVSNEYFFGAKHKNEKLKNLKPIPKQFYSTIYSARIAVKSIGAETESEYAELRHLKPKLPPNPASTYASEWKGWIEFFSVKEPRKRTVKYKTLAEAARAARTLGIKTARDYIKKFKQNPKLHSNPSVYYFGEWVSWEDFLGIKTQYYNSLALASKAAIKLKISTARDYIKRYKEDPKLPSNPSAFYADWVTWEVFLGKD